jgi:hypothetical protein
MDMFEKRMAAPEGAEAASLDRDRHGRGHHRADGPGAGGRHVVAAKALFGSCRW